MILPIIKPRAGGKTTALVNWVLGDLPHRIIVVADEQRADMLRDMIVHMAGGRLSREDLKAVNGLVVPFERRDSIRGRKVAVAIDDLDTVLQHMFWNEIHAFTMTGPSHDGEGRELVDDDAVYAFVNQRQAGDHKPPSDFSMDELRYLIEDAVHPNLISEEVNNRLVTLLSRVQDGVQERPPLISKSGQIRKSGEVVTFSNGTTMPLDMVMMLGATRVAENQAETTASLQRSLDASRPSPE